MSTVSQIITFRKGRAFTTRKPVPPVVPAPPATPSATVTIGAPAGTTPGQAVTYVQRVQKTPTVEIDVRPPRPGHDPAEELAESGNAAAVVAAPVPSPAPAPAAKADEDHGAGHGNEHDSDHDDGFLPTMPVDLIA